MSVGIGELYGDTSQVFTRLMNNIGFNTHVALPAIVQQVDFTKLTVDVQPTIRERTVNYSNKINYINYPLLINVPIVFPQVAGFRITFPISQGDECLVVFADTAIDNWWLYGNVQNPVEQRRHDLSDGFAIFGVMNQSALEDVQDVYDEGISIESSKTETYIRLSDSEIYLSCANGSTTLSKILDHIHVDSMGGPTQPSYNIRD
jgi:hypothetical protein